MNHLSGVSVGFKIMGFLSLNLVKILNSHFNSNSNSLSNIFVEFKSIVRKFPHFKVITHVTPASIRGR